ncbi:hypothetical protein NFO65_22430 [Neorhizobium galegae]|uniref:hypothetical protein n=1 Tax=Neorhizobium galegae TaxID=399 RepID=UPI002100E7C6|nr:hypothetical protein [Neorhizobium galegae]MCQ1573487.1 hypothetical protein [Neorhizobium galegae]
MRFSFNSDRHRIPDGYIFVDQALDRIGTSLWPQTWGKSRSYSSLPFDPHYFRCVLVENEDEWSQQREPVGVPDEVKSEYSVLWKQFSSVCIAFTHGVENAYFRIYPIDSIHGMQGHLPFGVASAQQELITHTGRARTSEGSAPLWLILLEAELDKWLASRGPQQVFAEEWAYDVLCSASGSMTVEYFDKRFWNEGLPTSLPKAFRLKGRATKRIETLMEEHQKLAVAFLKETPLITKALNEKPDTD